MTNDYIDEIKKMQWSYSRLTSFDHCKYEFYLQYIVADDDLYLSEGNYFAEVGSYMHKILEMIFKGELSVDDASQYFVDHFDENVFYVQRESIMNKTFENCADYLCNVDFSWLNDYEILGVEKKVEFQLGGYNFIGFIDLLLRDKRDNRIVILDNKSSEYPFRKDGKVKARLKDIFEKYKKQMYLYAFAVEQEYGELPKEITWNHFKDGLFATIPFSESEYHDAVNWSVYLIHKIEEEENYQSIIETMESEQELSKEYFYCNNLCNFRNSCEYNLSTDWRNL